MTSTVIVCAETGAPTARTRMVSSPAIARRIMAGWSNGPSSRQDPPDARIVRRGKRRLLGFFRGVADALHGDRAGWPPFVVEADDLTENLVVANCPVPDLISHSRPR